MVETDGMKRFLMLMVCTVSMVLSSPCVRSCWALMHTQERPSVLPAPKQLELQPGMCSIAEGVQVVVDDPYVLNQAFVVAEELHRMFGVRAVLVGPENVDPGTVQLHLDLAGDAQPDRFRGEDVDESYSLRIAAKRIDVIGGSPTGVSWGTATLLQWVQLRPGFGVSAPCVEIRDEPSHAYRTVLIDVARQPHSIEVLKGVVRAARLFKLRYIQLHLTDDQSFTLPFEPVTSKLEGNPSYTSEELAELVAYAEARGVVLFPEIDLPGHSSKLRQSGFLGGAQSDRDVASTTHWEGVRELIDAAIDAFPNSPYFHIGGDESGAGETLVPFLERVNDHVHSRGKRLIVWEGFHGAPIEQVPATGPKRVLVAAWESSYNAPWSLLEAGYEIVNASWKPLYVVGGDSRLHPGVSAGRKWSAETIARWDKDLFMHWEPGRPVYEGHGPGDADPLDREWRVPAEWRPQIRGAQLCFWEQRDSSVLADFAVRAPILAERLWNGAGQPAELLVPRSEAAVRRVWPLVQPVKLWTGSTPGGPMGSLGSWSPGGSIAVQVQARGVGEIRYSMADLGNDWNWIDAPRLPVPDRVLDGDSIPVKGNAVLRVGLFSESGQLLGASTHLRVFTWPARVRVTEYRLDPADWPRRLDPAPEPFDLDVIGAEDRVASYVLPMLRGPLEHLEECGQRFESELVAPFGGMAELGLKTQSGSAVAWLDLNRDGVFSEDERLLGPTPSSEQARTAQVELIEGERYGLRVDHLTRMPRPVVLMTLDHPGAERPREISGYLALPAESSSQK